MIYETLDAGEPIRQGDIFRNVPQLELPPLQAIPVVAEDKIEQSAWSEIASERSAISCVAAIRSVTAIALTQDCDAVRAREISLCEIGRFVDVEPRSKDATKPRAVVRLVTQHARVNQKWFYLPLDPAFGFAERMAVDFRSILRVPRTDLEQMRADHRVARLTDVALRHFRERAAEFFRRYPYDEWYPLNSEELAAYRGDKAEPVEPYPWQR